MNQQAINTLINEMDMSGVVSIHEKNETVFEQAYGYRDRANQLPNQMNTAFAIASGAKFFTALGIMVLVEQGKLQLNDKVFDIISSPCDAYDSNITVQHLLTHTSGLPDYFDEDEITGEFELSVPWHTLEKPSDYIKIMPQKPMKFSPGTSFHYNNSAFIFLAIIMEQLTGDYYQWIDEQIIAKYKASNTGYYRFDQLPANTANGYIALSEGMYKTNIYTLPVRGGGDGGIYTSAGDMHELWKSFLNGQIVSKKMVELMLTPHSKSNDLHYGLGVWLEQQEDVYHPFLIGQDFGVTFLTGYNLNTTQSYVLISNNGCNLWPIKKEMNRQ